MTSGNAGRKKTVSGNKDPTVPEEQCELIVRSKCHDPTFSFRPCGWCRSGSQGKGREKER